MTIALYALLMIVGVATIVYAAATDMRRMLRTSGSDWRSKPLRSSFYYFTLFSRYVEQTGDRRTVIRYHVLCIAGAAAAAFGWFNILLRLDLPR